VNARLVGPLDHLTVCDGVTARQFDGEWVVLDLKGGNYFGLDEIGGRIWQYSSEGHTLGDVARLLAISYEAPVETILSDVLKLANELLERGLLQIER
jgi:hypothetical protein